MVFFRELETDRLRLSNISAHDREFILTQFSNALVNRYLFDAEPLTDISGADQIISFYTQPEPRAQHRWILSRKDDGAKIGTCGFHAWSEPNGRSEIGYDLHPDYWGKGYMTEALRAICEFARTDMKATRIDACVYAHNERSVAVLERLGFAFAGQMKDEIFRGKSYAHKILTLDLKAD